MSAERFAEYLENMGHTVVKSANAWWFNSAPLVFQNFPFHLPASPTLGEVDSILATRGAAARYTCRLDQGRLSYKIACPDKNYDLKTLGGKARNQTRRGLENCVVRQLELSELPRLGALELDRDTHIRQGRSIPKNHHAHWLRYYEAARQSGLAEAWGSFVDDRLGAYLISFLIEGCANIFILRSDRGQLKQYPNNALVYSYTKTALSRKEVEEVSFGLEPIQTDLDSLDHFKTGMGYEKIPIGQRVQIHPLARLLCRGSLLNRLEEWSERRSNTERGRKLHGLFKWYREQLAADWERSASGRTGNGPPSV